jgi:hypothetical protein
MGTENGSTPIMWEFTQSLLAAVKTVAGKRLLLGVLAPSRRVQSQWPNSPPLEFEHSTKVSFKGQLSSF